MDEALPTASWKWPNKVLFAVLAALAASTSLLLAGTPSGLAAVWIGNGLLVGWLLVRPSRTWPPYLAIGVTIEIIARTLLGKTLGVAALLAFGNFLEVLIVAGAIRYFVPDVSRPEEWLRLTSIASSSTLLASALSGLIAARLTTALHGGSFDAYFVSWFAAHLLGMVVFATLVVVIQYERRELLFGHGRGWPFVVSMLLLVAVSLGVFLSRYPVMFLVYPILLLGAFRHRFAGVALGMLVVTAIGSIATALGKGPLWLVDGVGTTGRVALLQLYIAGGCLMTIPVALATGMRARLMQQVRESEYRYRLIADYSHDIIIRMRADGMRLYVSPASRDILGWEPDELLVPQWELIHPEDRDAQRAVLAEVIRSGGPYMTTYRICHKDGHYLWLEAMLQAIPGSAEGYVEVVLIGRDITRRMITEQALEASRKELERLARVDPLTGVANRRQLDERIDLALMRLQRNALPAALMYLDLDRFKEVNDTFGHAVGDEILRQFAHRLRRCVRGNDLVSRLGGDEFVVVIEDAKLPFAAEAIARKLLEETERPMFVEGHRHQITASIGIAYACKAVAASDLMLAADAALYEAKRAGRNTYRVRIVHGSASDAGQGTAMGSGAAGVGNVPPAA